MKKPTTTKKMLREYKQRTKTLPWTWSCDLLYVANRSVVIVYLCHDGTYAVECPLGFRVSCPTKKEANTVALGVIKGAFIGTIVDAINAINTGRQGAELSGQVLTEALEASIQTISVAFTFLRLHPDALQDTDVSRAVSQLYAQAQGLARHLATGPAGTTPGLSVGHVH